jgi:predicted nucleic acid-binding protein
VAYLFDTDAISELFRKRPAEDYVRWLTRVRVPREEQFTSAVVVGELYRGAYGSAHAARHVENIEARVLPALVVLPFDAAVARRYGEIGASLAGAGKRLADADLQIAAPRCITAWSS